MVWLEMSRDVTHGGGDWSFGKCLWSPTYKQHETLGRTKQGYWENMVNIRKGDTVLHLRGKMPNAKFVAQSVADIDGFKTNKRPPKPREWDYSDSFYKVPLIDFEKLPFKLPLRQVFDEKETLLRNYFTKNREMPSSERKKLFFVIQNRRLQCQNGAYLSEVDNELFSIIFDDAVTIEGTDVRNISDSTDTSSFVTKTKARIGQERFSKNVRKNYGNRCCFPRCEINQNRFLIGAHIARWADVEEIQGETSNGLCLCLMHDKAFEIGFYTIDRNFHISINENHRMNEWCITYISPYEGKQIRLGEIRPSIAALEYHWDRINFNPVQ